MTYNGPDYDERYGIILPGLDFQLHPRLMVYSQIVELLTLFPHLAPYFSEGGNGGGSRGPYVPLAWWDITPAKVQAILDEAATHEIQI